MTPAEYRKLGVGIVAVIALFASFGLGIYAGHESRPEVSKVTTLTGTEPPAGVAVDFEPFWRAWNIIEEKHVSGNGPDAEAKVWGAISGLVESLDDPYSVFLPPKAHERFESDISGEFQGVGMEIGIREGVLTVVAPLKDTPADRAGIRSGDIIIRIDDTVSAELSIDEAVDLIRGPKGTEVVLTVIREESDDPIEITIVRDVIEIPTIDTRVFSKEAVEKEKDQSTFEDAFVIGLYNFSANSPELFRESLREFVASGKHKLIIDLRGNPGGYLEAAVDMASWFLPAGKAIVREDFGSADDQQVYRSRGYDIFNEQLKMAILVDKGSASASEILAGALSEHGKAILVGTQTFGKGSVQELVPLTDNTSIKITIARWLTPNGVSISDGGLTPDYEVEISEDDIEAGRDPQLARAIELLGE